MKNVGYKDSNLENSVFQEIINEGIIFDNSNLKESNFHKSKLKGIDFTTSNIENIEVGIKEVKEAIFNVTQALDLTRLMKIIIK